MSNPMSSGVQIGGEATAIVQTLRDFGRNQRVPVDLLARLVGRETQAIRPLLDELASKKVVQLNPCEDTPCKETVTLIPQDKGGIFSSFVHSIFRG